jgi:hypothetical protein
MQSTENLPNATGKANYSTSRAEPHRVSLAVWDVPTPVSEGGSVRIKVGAKCEHGCTLAGSVIEVRNTDGNDIFTGVLGDSPAPMTSALYWAQVVLRVHKEHGRQDWLACFAGNNTSPPHAKADSKFTVLVIEPAHCRLTVSVSDAETKASLANAYVRVGDSTLFTDKSGSALVSIPSGSHELVVWKRDHKMSRSELKVTKDEDVRIELTPAPCKYCPDFTWTNMQ